MLLVVVMCVWCVCVCLCVFVCCGTLKKRGKTRVWIQKTAPCVHSKRPRVYRHVPDSSNHSFYLIKLSSSSYPDGDVGPDGSISLSPSPHHLLLLSSLYHHHNHNHEHHNNTHRETERQRERQRKKTKPKFFERFARPSTTVSWFFLLHF